MKKLLLLVTLCMCCAGMAEASDRPRQEIQISDASNPIHPDQIRSAGFSLCDAWVDYEMGCIGIAVNAPLGKVNIVITDMYGMPAAKASIDTATIDFVMLPIPAQGIYTVLITAQDYTGTGNFTID